MAIVVGGAFFHFFKSRNRRNAMKKFVRPRFDFQNQKVYFPPIRVAWPYDVQLVSTICGLVVIAF